MHCGESKCEQDRGSTFRRDVMRSQLTYFRHAWGSSWKFKKWFAARFRGTNLLFVTKFSEILFLAIENASFVNNKSIDGLLAQSSLGYQASYLHICRYWSKKLGLITKVRLGQEGNNIYVYGQGCLKGEREGDLTNPNPFADPYLLPKWALFCSVSINQACVLSAHVCLAIHVWNSKARGLSSRIIITGSLEPPSASVRKSHVMQQISLCQSQVNRCMTF